MNLMEATGTIDSGARPAPDLRVVSTPDRGARALGRLTALLLSGDLASDDDIFVQVRVVPDALRIEVGVFSADRPDLDLRSRRSAMRRSSTRLQKLVGVVREFADRWEWEPGPPARLSFEVDGAGTRPAASGRRPWR